MASIAGIILIIVFGYVGISTGSIAFCIIDPSKSYPGETKRKLGVFKTFIVAMLLLLAILSLIMVFCGFGLLFGG